MPGLKSNHLLASYATPAVGNDQQYTSLSDLFQESEPEENQLSMSRDDLRSPKHDIVVFRIF